MTREFRVFNGGNPRIETRADGKKQIVGYGAVFYNAADPGTQYEMFSDLIERVAPGCFNRCLAERQDVRGLFNHDANIVLGRTPATMRLSVDATGLKYEIDPPDTEAARGVMASIERGDVSGSSFSFSVRAQTWEEVRDADGNTTDIRTLTDVDLYDVGPVTFPAYEAATSGTRSEFSTAVESRDQWRKEREKKPETVDSVAVRARAVAVS